MIKELTNYEIVQIINRLNLLTKTSFPFQITRSIVKTLKNLQEEYEIYNHSYKYLLNTYYEVDETGNIIKNQNGELKLIDDKNKNEAISKITDLLNEKVSAEIFQFNESELDKIENISPEDYMLFEEYLIKK